MPKASTGWTSAHLALPNLDPRASLLAAGRCRNACIAGRGMTKSVPKSHCDRHLNVRKILVVPEIFVLVPFPVNPPHICELVALYSEDRMEWRREEKDQFDTSFANTESTLWDGRFTMFSSPNRLERKIFPNRLEWWIGNVENARPGERCAPGCFLQ